MKPFVILCKALVSLCHVPHDEWDKVKPIVIPPLMNRMNAEAAVISPPREAGGTEGGAPASLSENQPRDTPKC